MAEYRPGSFHREIFLREAIAPKSPIDTLATIVNLMDDIHTQVAKSRELCVTQGAVDKVALLP